MNQHVVLVSIPGLTANDLALMPRLSAIAAETLPLVPSFPCVTCPVQATLTTGVSAEKHGIVANGFYWRDKAEVEMWTAWNEVYQAPQIWSKLKAADDSLTSLVWFPMLCKGTDADVVAMPAPVHNPDGSESLWCYTRPEMFYQQLLDELGHFPLMNFWGPLANISSNQWIVDSAIIAAKAHRPRFSYIYLPHMDNVIQKFGPGSEQVEQGWHDYDAMLGTLIDGYADAGIDDALWLFAGEYAITPVDGATYPNRVLREAGYLSLDVDDEGRETLNPGASRAWVMVDHQFAHVFVKDKSDVSSIAALFRSQPGVAQVAVGEERSILGLNHERSGEIILLSDPAKWFAYYWWLDDAKAPPFARTVDIHRKPGYDPVELFIDMPTKSTPLDPSLVKASHGYPADHPERHSVLITSNTDALPVGTAQLHHADVPGFVYRNFGVA